MADIKKQQELAAELSSKLWAMANDLRGNMEAYEFKNYILGLLFYKELSDRTEKFVAELLQEDNTTFEAAWKDEEYKEAIVDEMLIKLGYVLEPKYLFPEMLELIRKDEFSIDYFEEAINSIIASTQGQESEQDFDGLFEDMDLKSSKLGKEIKQRSKLIGKVLQTIDSIEVDLGDTDVDVLGTAYVTLIGLFAQTAGKKGGEFYTPTNMSKLVARLATVGLTKVLNVADCACGSGSLLLQVGEYVDVAKYYGQELTSSTYNLARMNMILHGIDYKNFSIINVDTLEDDTTFADEKYTIQVANPPYSTNWSANPKFLEDDRFSAYGSLAPKSRADFAFLQHMVHHMANGDSRIAILLPPGVLYRDGSEAEIRNYLVNNMNIIDAIIGLPPKCFQGTPIPVCCLVLKKERNGNSDNICFIDASRDFVAERAMNYITEEHIEKIVAAYTERVDIEKYCHIASMEEIEKNHCNLNISRYIDAYEEEIVDLSATRNNILALIENDKKVETEIATILHELGLENFFDSESQDSWSSITDYLRFKKVDGTEYPELQTQPIGSLCTFDKGKGLSWDDVDDEQGSSECILYGNLYTDYGAIIKDIAHKTSVESSKMVKSKQNDILIPGSDTTPTGLARAACIKKDGVLLGGDINILHPKNISGEYLAYAINSNKRKLVAVIEGSTVRHIHNDDIEEIELTLTQDEEEQAKISNILDLLDQKIELEQQKIAEWQQIKQGLLQKLFNKQ